jgi:hypothetical protein
MFLIQYSTNYNQLIIRMIPIAPFVIQVARIFPDIMEHQSPSLYSQNPAIGSQFFQTHITINLTCSMLQNKIFCLNQPTSRVEKLVTWLRIGRVPISNFGPREN